MNSVSDLILKKGPLASAWIAGTATDKLGKKIVLATDITALANQIMEEERVNLVLRLSGMLLKGLVIVYSKKMQYMLTDCEEIINKIKLSFKPGQIDLIGKNSKDETVTITANLEDITLDPTVELSEWAKTANPEEFFIVEHPQIEFQTPQATPMSSELADSAINSSTSSQIPDEDIGTPYTPTFTTPKRYEERPIPEWDDVPVPMPQSDDDIPMPDYANQPESDIADDEESEANQPKEKEKEKKKQQVVVDANPKPSQNRRVVERARRTLTEGAKTAPAAKSNSSLGDLFDECRQMILERAQEQNENQEEFDDDDGFPMPLPDTDTDLEVERFRDAQVPDAAGDASMSSDDENSISGSDAPPLDLPRPPLDSPFKPLQSPYPNMRFAVEQTPRRTAEESINTSTFRTLNTVREKLAGKDEVSFAEISSGMSRHAAAAAFYQLLVLKSTDTVQLRQEKPFAPIEVTPGPKFGLYKF